MAQAADIDTDAEDDAAFEGSPSRIGRKKLLIIIGVALGVLLIGGGVGTYKFIASKNADLEATADQANDKTRNRKKAEKEAPTEVLAPVVFYDLPDMLVNIDTGSRKRTFLKLKMSVELAHEEDIPKVEDVLPKIVDNFQIYLRDLKPSQVEGAAGAFRIREELLVRMNAAVRPVQVKDVLVKEMLLQ